MPDLVADLLCILEHAGVQKVVIVGYVAPKTEKKTNLNPRRFTHYPVLQGMTGAPSCHTRLHASGRTFSRPSWASLYR